jgi:ABC-type glycerol-3-phosphate transport system substrate-binding protein
MSDSKQEGLLGRPVSRRQVLASGLAAGAAAFVAAAGSSSALAQSPSPSPVPTPVPSGDGSFSGTMLQGFSGGFSMPAEFIGLAAWAGATGGNATFTNVPFTEKPEVIAAMISTQDSNWDSIYTNDNFMARFGARLLTPTTDWYTADDLMTDFYPSAIATYTASDGVLRGLPIHYDGYASGYNQDLFDKIGVSTPPTTWAELFALAPKFIEAGIIPSIQPWVATDGTFGAFYWKQIYNSLAHPMFSDDRTQLMFDGPEGLKAFQTVQDGLTSKFWDPTYMNLANEHNAFDEFAKGNVAFLIVGSDSVAKPGTPIEKSFKLMANPGIDPGTTGSVNGSDGLGLSKFSQQQPATSSYLATQFSPDVCLQVALAPQHYAPTRNSVLNNADVQTYDASLVPLWAAQSQGSLNLWSTPYDYTPVFDDVLAKMVSGEYDAAKAQAAAVEGTQKVIQEWLLA